MSPPFSKRWIVNLYNELRSLYQRKWCLAKELHLVLCLCQPMFSRDKTASRDYIEVARHNEIWTRSYNTEMLKVFTMSNMDVLSNLWWSLWGSNPRPQHCQRCALPTELKPHYQTVSVFKSCLGLVGHREVQTFTRLKSDN